MEILPKSTMAILPKPRHPDLDKCSREECQTMVDMSSVRLLASMTSKIDEKIDRASEKISSRTELLISNAVLKLKDELRTLNTEAFSVMRRELDQLKSNWNHTSSDHLDTSTASAAATAAACSENTENLHKLKVNVQKLYDAFNER